MMKRSLLIGIVALVVILAFPVGVSAEDATTTMGLQIHISSTISMSAGTVNFGTLAPGNDATANTTVTITTNAPHWHVDINNGQNPEPGTGWSRMKSATGDNYLPSPQICTARNPLYTPILSGINRILMEADGTSPVLYFIQHVDAGTPAGNYADTYTLTATLD